MKRGPTWLGWVMGSALALSMACGDDETTDGTATGSTATGGTATGGTSTGAATCDDACPALIAAGCETPVPSLQECLDECNANVAGPCGAEMQAFLSCAGADPPFECDGDDAVVPGCESEENAMGQCAEQNEGGGGVGGFESGSGGGGGG